MSTVFYSAFLIRTGSLCISIFHPAVGSWSVISFCSRFFLPTHLPSPRFTAWLQPRAWPRARWSSLQPRGVAVTMIETDWENKAFHLCEASSWLRWEALWHTAIALKEAKDIDTTSRMLPAAYSDARQDFFLASPGNLMGSPNLAHHSFSVSAVNTIQV